MYYNVLYVSADCSWHDATPRLEPIRLHPSTLMWRTHNSVSGVYRHIGSPSLCRPRRSAEPDRKYDTVARGHRPNPVQVVPTAAKRQHPSSGGRDDGIFTVDEVWRGLRRWRICRLLRIAEGKSATFVVLTVRRQVQQRRNVVRGAIGLVDMRSKG